jgi:hypothetical protein
MNDIYLWTAILGCTLLLLQVILQLFGLGQDDAGEAVTPDTDVDAHDGIHDPGHGAGGNVFAGFLSFKALVAFFGIFGLTGLSLEDAGLHPVQRLGISVLAGFLAMALVAYLMRMLYRLGASGSLVVRDAVGHVGTVYLRIPGHGAGQGKVTLSLQGRSVELPAVTDEGDLPTGRQVRVVEVLSNETVKVVSA